MSTQKLNIPAEMPPEAPAELHAKRDALMPELDKAIKGASGTLQAALRKMNALLANTKPGVALDAVLYQDVKAAFQRYAQDTAAPAAPPVLMQALEWLQEYLTARGFAPTEQAAPSKEAAPAARARGSSDGFDSGGARPMALPTDDAVRRPLDPKAEAESFKAWTKNPAMGKLKG